MKDNRSSNVTDCIYERDSYISEFSATVLNCEKVNEGEDELYMAVLDLTVFFPEGGGQKSDTGLINGIEVVDVQIQDGKVIHYMKAPVLEGSVVTGSIDFEKRYSRMQNHSAEHLLCGLIHNAYGYDNVGFHLNDECVTFDVDGALSDEQLAEVEEKANQLIYENVPIVISFPAADELDSIQYRSKLEMTENVRLVSIEGYDICACCAPHVRSTGEIGLIHVIEAVPHRGGTRITMLAGKRAYNDYLMLDCAGRSIMATVSSKREDTASFVMALDERYKKLLQENTKLKKQITELTLREINDRIEKRDSNDTRAFLIFTEELDDVQLRNLINDCKEKMNCIVAGFIGNEEKGYRYIISVNKVYADNMETKLNMLAASLSEEFGGRGGGSPVMIQGQVRAERTELDKFFEKYK